MKASIISIKEPYTNEEVQSIYQQKLLAEFHQNIPLDQDPKQIYDNLCKEKELFIYSTYEDLTWDNKWRYCVVNKDSFDSLLNEGSPIEEKDFGLPMTAVVESFGGISRTGNEELGGNHFVSLLTNPAEIDSKILRENLLVLCQLDAYTTLELILKSNPELSIDLSELLTMAIQCLNLSTIQSLINLGANLHKPILVTHDTDNGINIFGSPLFFAVYLPGNPQSGINRYDQAVKPDHPKLVSIIKYLLSKGAKPEQKCILTSDRVFSLDKVKIVKEAEIEQLEKDKVTEAERTIESEDVTKKAVEIEWNCKVLAKDYLSHEISKTFSIDCLDTLKSLSDSALTPLSSTGFFAENSVRNSQVQVDEDTKNQQDAICSLM